MDIVKLRGHHLAVFANYIKQKEAGLDFSMQTASFLGDHLSKQLSMYGFRPKQGQMPFSERLWIQFLENPDQGVEIVNGLDEICQKECSAERQAGCPQSSEDNEDDITLRKYGLKVGQKLTASQIVESIRRYHSLTGYYSPRDAGISRLLNVKTQTPFRI